MTYVSIHDATGAYTAPATEYEAIVHAVETNATWLRFSTIDGVDCMLRTSEVVAVNYISDAAARALDEREARERMEGA